MGTILKNAADSMQKPTSAQLFFSINEMCKYLVDVVVLSGPMGSKTPTYRGILLSLASISRTISAYALDALWETLDDIVPLIHLLPRDSFKYDEYHGQTNILRPLSESDFLLVEKYAYRIRTVQRFSQCVPPLRAMAAVKPPLLPNLQKVDVGFLSDIVDLLLDVCPSVAHLVINIGLESASTPTGEIAARIPELFPSLRSFRCHGSYPFFPVLCDALSVLSSLEAVEILAIVESEVLIPLSALPNLKRLHCFLADEPPRLELGEGSFPVLEDINLSGIIAAPNLIATLLQSHISSTRVGKIRASTQSTDIDLNLIVKAVATPHSSTLRSLWLTFKMGGRAARETPNIDYTPLLACHHLELFVMEMSSRLLELHDHDIESMGRAWPRLRKLKLGLNPTPTRPMVTLQALRRLAQLCQMLDILEISVDASADISAPQESATHPSWLRQLHLLPSVPSEDVDAVVRFVRETFPHLTGFSGSVWPSSLVDRGNWEEAMRSLPSTSVLPSYDI